MSGSEELRTNWIFFLDKISFIGLALPIIKFMFPTFLSFYFMFREQLKVLFFVRLYYKVCQEAIL